MLLLTRGRTLVKLIEFVAVLVRHLSAMTSNCDMISTVSCTGPTSTLTVEE